MSRLPFFVFAAAALVLAASADAQVYKWKDANGVTHYSDSAPPGGTSYQRVQVNSGAETGVTRTPAASSGASSASASPAQAATQPAPASTTRIPDNAANRAKLCKDLNSNISLLGGSAPLTSGDSSTPQQNMSDVQRQQELATARAQKQQYCQ